MAESALACGTLPNRGAKACEPKALGIRKPEFANPCRTRRGTPRGAATEEGTSSSQEPSQSALDATLEEHRANGVSCEEARPVIRERARESAAGRYLGTQLGAGHFRSTLACRGSRGRRHPWRGWRHRKEAPGGG